MKRAALKYIELGCNIIPCSKAKKPLIEWKKYQTEKVTPELINEWWVKWPDANIGIVTGITSKLVVIDVDSEDGLLEIDKVAPGMQPTVKSPNGWHYYCRHTDNGIGNSTRFLPDCDIRGQGGYIIAPPSINESGIKYQQLLPINQLEAIPGEIVLLINAFNKTSSLYTRARGVTTGDYSGDTDYSLFNAGTRDEDLFHTANCLIKGGMEPQNARQILEILAKNCKPPFPEEEVQIKIESALKRDGDREKTIIQELRDIIRLQTGYITTTNGHNWLQVTTRKDKKTVNQAFARLEKEDLIEKTGKKAGEYRIKSKRVKAEKLTRTAHKYANMWLPFKLNDVVDIPEGGLIIVAGSPNAGKSACLFNIAKRNQKKWKVKYLSTETTNDEMSARLSNAFPDENLEDWTLEFYKVEPENLMDNVYDSDNNTLWLIDYVEKYDVFFTIGQDLATLHSKLNGGVMVASVQKNPAAEVGLGGFFTMMKPTLGLALDWDHEEDEGTCTITKAKAVKYSHRVLKQYGDPTKKQYKYKLIDNVKPKEIAWWTRPQKKGK